jgi:ADP-ribosylglycohydrolase
MMSQFSPAADKPMARAVQSLQGLSCGDAFGERFFLHEEVARKLIAQRILPSPPWHFTDDTVMALSITENLEEHGEIRQTSLAASFGAKYVTDPQRGYGMAMHGLLPELARAPSFWQDKGQALFGGRGSFGNGSAMRVAPLGAYFADDLDALVKHAELSAAITHSHHEGIVGAISVALAAALAWRHKNSPMTPVDFLQQVCELTPMSEVHLGIVTALALPADVTVEAAAATLGNGSRVTAQDTVPFTLWVAAHHLDNYEEALWTTVSALGDRDTTCAIVGGIVALSAGAQSIPESWIQAREPIPAWFLYPNPGEN